ncbi:MAG: outer membrane beta-barrel protein [Spirochaetia bacterium]
MKKIIVLFTALALVAVSASAIDFHVGVKAGGSLVMGAGTKAPDYDSPHFGWGFVGGVAADIGILDFLGVELDVFYSGMYDFGYNTTGVNPMATETLTQTVSAIEIPVLVKGSLELGPGSLFLSAGGDFFILLGKKPIITADGDELDSSFVAEYDNTFLYGITAGLGYSFSLGMGTLSIEIRYKYAFNFFYEEGGSKSGSPNDSGISGFDLIIGYYFL